MDTTCNAPKNKPASCKYWQVCKNGVSSLATFYREYLPTTNEPFVFCLFVLTACLSPCDAKIRIPLGRWGRVKKSPCIIKYVGGFFFREWHKGDWHFCVMFLSMCTPTIVARQAWIKFVTSLNQNPRRLELKLRQAQIRIETGLEFFRERLKKKLLSLRRFFSEPLPIFFWAFGDFFLSLRWFCFKPLRILFWACVRNVSGRTHFVTKPHPFLCSQRACPRVTPCDLYSGIIRKYVWIGV